MSRMLLPWHQSLWRHLQETRRQGRLPHALLLSGARGLGKVRFATQLGASLLCEQPREDGVACGQCKQCLLYESGNHPDLRWVKPEEGKQQIGIEAVRELVAGNTLSVGEKGYRLFIIEPADTMTTAAANALLKTLEEPISGTLILMLSSHAERLPVTIRSRCQSLKFSPPDEDVASAWVRENTAAKGEQVTQLLQLAGGAPLKIPLLIERNELQRHNHLLNEFVGLVENGSGVAQAGESWLKEYDFSQLLTYMIGWLVATIRYIAAPSSKLAFPPLQTLSERLDLELAYQLLDRLYEIERMSVNNLNPQLALESILLEWSRIENRGN